MQIDVTQRGEVPEDAQSYAHERIGALDRFLRDRIVRAHVVLHQEPNPRIERPARAECELHLNGPIVRGQVADIAMHQAIDSLGRHLERQLRRFADRRLAELRRPTDTPEGEWRHGDWSPPRPDFYPRPPEERQVLRRKTFAMEPMTPAEAVEDLEALDHSFYLFQDRDSGVDAVVYRRDDGRLGVIGPARVGWEQGSDAEPIREESRSSEPTELENAVAEMNELNHRFLYFTDAASGRGHVIYLRYDGNYGLIAPR